MTPSSFKLAVMSLPLFLAESTTDSVKSSAIGEWVVVGAAVLVIIQVGWSFWDRLRGGVPQKREVSFAGKYATDEEMTNVHGRIKRERLELDKQIEELKAEDRRLREKLEHEIDNLQERIDLVPERTITLLRDTKGLI